MLKALKRIQKIKELERLMELQKLENLKGELSKLDEERRKILNEVERKMADLSDFKNLLEVAVLGRELRNIEKRREETERNLDLQEEKLKKLNLEKKVIETYIERKERALQKEEEKREEQKRGNEHLLKRSYGKFLLSVAMFLCLPLFGNENSTLPYTEVLIKPYLELQSREFEKLADRLLESFKKLEEKERQLEKKKEFILKKEEELRKLLEEAMEAELVRRREMDQKVKRLLEVINKSDPDSVGEMLSKTDPELAAEVLVNLPKVRVAGEILASMEPDAAAKVVEALLKKREKSQISVVRKKIEEILKYAEQNSF